MFSMTLIHIIQVNQFSEAVFGERVFSSYQPPSQYTGELFGVQYLYEQTGWSFNATEDQLDSQIDEIFADVDNLDEPVVAPIIDHDEHPTTMAPPVDSETLPSSPEWRRRKATGETRPRKTYTCKVCGKPMSGNGDLQQVLSQ